MRIRIMFRLCCEEKLNFWVKNIPYRTKRIVTTLLEKARIQAYLLILVDFLASGSGSGSGSRRFKSKRTNPQPWLFARRSGMLPCGQLEHVHIYQGTCPCAEPACPDLHPILYWNLVYLFHRIAAPSHLPGLLLDTPSLALLRPPPHPSWRGANHTTVKVPFIQCFGSVFILYGYGSGSSFLAEYRSGSNSGSSVCFVPGGGATIPQSRYRYRTS
jgi:hypothetical protein